MSPSSTQQWTRRIRYSDQHIRVSDAERNAVAELLGQHYADGLLDQAEFDERVGRTMAAKTRGDLSGLFDDLPETETGAERAARGDQCAVRSLPGAPSARRGGIVRSLLLLRWSSSARISPARLHQPVLLSAARLGVRHRRRGHHPFPPVAPARPLSRQHDSGTDLGSPSPTGAAIQGLFHGRPTPRHRRSQSAHAVGGPAGKVSQGSGASPRKRTGSHEQLLRHVRSAADRDRAVLRRLRRGVHGRPRWPGGAPPEPAAPRSAWTRPAPTRSLAPLAVISPPRSLTRSRAGTSRGGRAGARSRPRRRRRDLAAHPDGGRRADQAGRVPAAPPGRSP